MALRLAPAALIAAFALALVASLLSFMTIAAVLPALIAEWSLTNAEAGWIGGALFAGYVASVLFVAPLADRIDPKGIYLACAATGALGAFGMALFADGFESAVAFRVLTGIGVGGTHVPGLKALTDQLPPRFRARGVVYYTAVFAIGSGLSIYIGGEAAAWLGWRWAFAIGGFGFIAALLVVAAVLPATEPAPRTGPARSVLDFRPVLKNRTLVAYMISAVGTSWEVFASRVWMVTFLVMLQARDGGTHWVNAAAMATLMTFIGVPASMSFGETAARIDRRGVVMTVASLSAASGIAVGFLADAPYWIVVTMCFVFSALSYGRTAANTGGTVAAAPPELRGTALALNAAVSFTGGLLGPFAVGVALDLGGGIDAPRAWQIAFATMALGPIVGVLALLLYARPVRRR